jgi:cob(I)alamin adenosyltransferase
MAPKIYTRTGDTGQTGLFGGERVEKTAQRVVAYGTVDELNAMLGVARATTIDPALDPVLAHIQNELFVLGADLATPGESTRIDRLSEEHTARMEQEIDQLEADIEPVQQFILPGGAPLAAHLHLARTICRRAEREVVALAASEPINQAAIAYLNRLSDWLFVAARRANANASTRDTPVSYQA